VRCNSCGRGGRDLPAAHHAMLSNGRAGSTASGHTPGRPARVSAWTAHAGRVAGNTVGTTVVGHGFPLFLTSCFDLLDSLPPPGGAFTESRVGARLVGDRSRWSRSSISHFTSDLPNQDADSMLRNTLWIEESNSADVQIELRDKRLGVKGPSGSWSG